MLELSLVQKLASWIPPVLLGITVHEVAHGWVASKLGDMTASKLGRLTLNPLKHIDPVGTILIPGMMMLLKVGFIFGYAKPVPVAWQNLRNPKRDMAIVAVAGPLSNLLMAFIWALLTRAGLLAGEMGVALVYMGVAGISINMLLMILNLLPLPPLDGGRVATGLLPMPLAYWLSRIEPFGFVILIVLLVSGVLNDIVFFVGPYILVLQEMLTGLPAKTFLWILKSLLGI